MLLHLFVAVLWWCQNTDIWYPLISSCYVSDWDWFWGGLLSQRTRAHANRKSNPEAVRPRVWAYCPYKPECIVTKKTDTPAFFTIKKTWEMHLGLEARAVSCAAPIVTWCPLTTKLVASECPCPRDAVLATCYLTPLKSACLNPVERIIPQWNIFTLNFRT